ncbi:kinase-like domain-containing protein [Podospora aff. communis PSN243]|uniref:Kinase-like domain-containing protein n=1 Tax=Podospora aff. communis PSN243 TaxID=3040156 RepID=A0AAV9G867_9PEZI|nr:kinase-like domain-containing protein [Podospora aff. communis PSN243]
MAVRKANSATELDSEGHAETAKETYTEACHLLRYVISRTGEPGDRDKLKNIHSTYRCRIAELNDSASSDSKNPVPDDQVPLGAHEAILNLQMGALDIQRQSNHGIGVNRARTSVRTSQTLEKKYIEVDYAKEKHQLYNEGPFLGKGAYAVVKEVKRKADGRLFALKTYYANVRDLEYIQWQFHNEIQTMKALSGHHHIIRYIDSYIMDQQLAIIVEPVAKPGSLAVALHHIQNRGQPTEQESRTLLRAFGCLASGLAFIHEKVVRLKDIKPDNILLHGEEVLYADFGVAFIASDRNTTTDGVVLSGFTRRYCAPEVTAHSRRNRKSDVFSLGAVYCDILAVLDPVALPPEMLKSCYDQNAEPIRQRLFTMPDNVIALACYSMLAAVNGQRPSASEVESYLRTYSGSTSVMFCERCT